MRAWVLTDGAPDREEACLGVAEAVAERIERRCLAPRAPWRWLAPWGPIDPRDDPKRGSRLILPSDGSGWPDIVVASGRVAAPYLARIKKASAGAVVAVFIGKSSGSFSPDLMVAPAGEGGPAGALRTRTWPSRVNGLRLAAARGAPPLVAPELDGPRIGVLIDAPIGGEDAARLVGGLRRLREQGAALSVRPPAGASEALLMALAGVAHYLWSGDRPDPYMSILGQSEALIVTAQSTRILSDAVATGAPVMTFTPGGAPWGARRYLEALAAQGLTRPFAGAVERYAYAPPDSTREVAHAIHALVTTRAALRNDRIRRTPARTRETNGPAPR